MLGVVAQGQLNREVQGAVNQALDFFDHIWTQADKIGYPPGTLSTPGDDHHRPYFVFLYGDWCESSHRDAGVDPYSNRFGQCVEIGAAVIGPPVRFV